MIFLAEVVKNSEDFYSISTRGPKEERKMCPGNWSDITSGTISLQSFIRTLSISNTPRNFVRDSRDLHTMSGFAKDTLIPLVLFYLVRLCSDHYSEFQRHPFFEGTDWPSIESAPVLIQYDPISEVYAQELAFRNNLHEELLTPQIAVADIKKTKIENKGPADDSKAARSKVDGAASAPKTSPKKKSQADPAPAGARHANFFAGTISPSSSPLTEQKRARLFADMSKITVSKGKIASADITEGWCCKVGVSNSRISTIK